MQLGTRYTQRHTHLQRVWEELRAVVQLEEAQVPEGEGSPKSLTDQPGFYLLCPLLFFVKVLLML